MIKDSDLLVSLKKIFYSNTIRAIGGEKHNIFEEGIMVAKFITNEINNIFKILYIPNIKKKMLSIGVIIDDGFSVEFFLQAYLIKNIKTKALVMKNIRVRKRGLYKLEA